jgi:hypothetical protein
MENALTREETLRGMTIWALISEKKSRSWQMGRFCDYDKDIMKIEESEIGNEGF